MSLDPLDHVVDVRLREAGKDRRVDHGRSDAVDEHSRSGDILPNRLRHADDGCLRGGVGGGHRVSLLAGDRDDEDDSAVAAGDYARDHGAPGIEAAVRIHR